MGFSVRVAPGVRIRASTRGVRTSLGPRVARVHVGSGRPGVSTGVGPVGYYTSIGSRPPSARRTTHTPGPAATTAAGARAAEKQAQAEALAKELHRIANLHRESYAPAQAQRATPPPKVDIAPIKAEHARQARAATSIFDRTARRAALEDGVGRAQAEAHARIERFAHQYAAWQAELNAEWASLMSNSPTTVMEVLARTFEDNLAVAAPLGVNGAEVSLLVVVPGPAALPSRQPAITAAGNLSLKKLTMRESAALYKAIVGGHALATVRETFAVAPRIASARVVVARQGGADTFGVARPEVLLAATFTRDLDAVRWATADAWQVIQDASDQLVAVEKGVTRGLVPVDLSKEPALADVLGRVDFSNPAS